MPRCTGASFERGVGVSPIIGAFPVVLGSIAVEAVIARRRGMAVYDIADTVTRLQTGVLSKVAGVFTKLLTFATYGLAYRQLALFDWAMDNVLLWAAARHSRRGPRSPLPFRGGVGGAAGPVSRRP